MPFETAKKKNPGCEFFSLPGYIYMGGSINYHRKFILCFIELPILELL